MYRNFFGFSEKPFDLTPDPKFLYLSRSHVEALASLTYGIHDRRGLVVMVGEVGTGKTLLLNAVLDRLDESTKIAYIFHTDVTFKQMLRMALVDLGLARPEETLTKTQSLHRLNDFAIRQLHRGSNVALIVDEAQNLDRASMENLRLLSNLETHKHKLIQIVLAGQPELDTKLNQPELRQLTQRISLRRYISPLSQKETYGYIRHRLRVADYKGSSLFDSKAEQLIWEYSGGIPRKINILCDNALLIGYALREKKIKAPVVEEALNDLSWSPYSRPTETLAVTPTEVPESQAEKSTSPPLFALAVTLVLIVGLIVTVVLVLGNSRLKIQKHASLPQHTPIQLNMPRELADSDQSPTQSQPVHYVQPAMVAQEKGPGGNPDLDRAEQSEAPIKPLQVLVAKRGDNLFRIITGTYGKYDTGILNAVLRENPEIHNPDRIFVGQVITLPQLN